MPDFLFRGSIADLDPDLYELSQFEAERQYKRLILIPSESAAPLAIREALGTAFQNVYAEGYPPEETRRMSEAQILDYEQQLTSYRRYSDPRYYKGVEYADIVEALARRRCAEAFASNGITADEIYVNVQALSGAPANNAVYTALVNPGDTVMGMDLLHGGHLTHGSPANRSGKLYNAVHYTVDSESERIDYDQIAALVEENQPKMIIAGYSSYPWTVDWDRFRAIADSVGAYLMADIAHVAGLVTAGVYPSPVGIADVITFTTHKSLCGPRGAAILTTSPSIARQIDRAVFPGEQGGPHVNTMVGQALAFKLAMTPEFKSLQKQIVQNCVCFTNRLADAGFRIPFGGTDTHLMNLDCRSIEGEGGATLSGDQAARILDTAGIVVNRNTIPGDTSALNPSGIRMGTSWITQRGFDEGMCEQMAGIIARVLQACTPYQQLGRRGMQTRAKVDFDVLNEAKIQVRDLAMSMGINYEPSQHFYPHFYYIDDDLPEGPFLSIEVEGREAPDLLGWITSARPHELSPGESVRSKLSMPGMEPIEIVLSQSETEMEWSMVVARNFAARALSWLRDLSDGYVQFDRTDLLKKTPGPIIVRLGMELEEMPDVPVDDDGVSKPWFLSMPDATGDPLSVFSWQETESKEMKKTALYETHRALGAKLAPFAGWEMPVWYSSVLEEHQATRHSAGLFDVSHMGVYQVEGHTAAAFLDCVATNDVSRLKVGDSHYTQFLDPDGQVFDDAMIYRRDLDRYLVVVNASNDDKDWAWLNAVQEGSVLIDRERPWTVAYGRGCRIMNLRSPEAGNEMRVDIALQGPKSRDILLSLGSDEETAKQLKGLPWASVMEGDFGGIDLVVSRTGYTGERIAYELFVHPENSVKLWNLLLETGEASGLKPVGLGARDSLRTEAGLPLYGHEMAGDLNLGVGDAGFAAYVKTYKPWFVGRSAFLQQEAERKAEVTRFRFDERGVRMAHHGDPVVDRRGRVIGYVTSCAVDGEGYLLGQAYLEKKYLEVGTPVAIYQSAAEKPEKAASDLLVGDRISIPTPATVISRFP